MNDMNEAQALLAYAKALRAIWLSTPLADQKAMSDWLKEHSIPTPLDLDGYASQIERSINR